jgi:hypothetical protein
MPIHSKTNPYPGINAHVNSFLQATKGEWESFHAEHIIDIRRAITAILPQGYYARSERSLQISEITISEPLPRTQRTQGDVIIYQTPERGTAAAPLAEAAPTHIYNTLMLLQMDDEPTFLTATVIYQGSGKPVTRIELRSPSNKSSGSHHKKYKQHRLETVLSGIHLVELDYLHELPPIVPTHPSYETGDSGADPLRMMISFTLPSTTANRLHILTATFPQTASVLNDV